MTGQEAAQAQLERARREVDQKVGLHPARPACLVVIQVGNNAASSTYIGQKKKAAETYGVLFKHVHLPADTRKEKLLQELKREATDSKVDGIIVQLPLDTPHIAASEVPEILDAIPPDKDADGLHTINQGALFTGESTPGNWTSPLPATPLGCYRLLEHYGLAQVQGLDAVVVGRSRLVGLPVAILLSHAGATVTVCHSKTRDTHEKCRKADLVIVAAGRKHLLGPGDFKKGAVVVDVGMHRQDDGKLTGDVNPAAAPELKALSPVPRGVGPMTVASLIENVLRLYSLHLATHLGRT